MSEKRVQSDISASPSSRPAKKPRFSTQGKGIKEEDVGITAYLSSGLGGFTGGLKQRYTDFLVNEIDLQGKVLHLTDYGILDKKERRLQKRKQERQEKEEAQKAEAVEEVKEEKEEEEKPKVQEFTVEESKKAEIIAQFGEDDFNALMDLIKSPPKPAEYHSTKVFDDKKSRGQLHQLIREAFQGKLETKTTPKNTFQFVLVQGRPSRPQKFQGEALDSKDENGVENWGLGPVKEFLHFNLYKENKDTMEAANVIGRLLRIQPRFIRFAGTKDRRACTVQRLCLTRFKVERVNALNKALRGMKLGCFSYEDNTLSLGDLQGNEFVITLRDVTTTGTTEKPVEEVVSTALDSLRDNGFINYYGMQRFGTFSVSTHTIGKEILLSNWKKVANMILSVQELVLPDSIKGRQIWEESKDVESALENMPKKCIAEWSILNHLKTCKKGEDGDYADMDYFYAIMKIPRNLRIMYGHAYQSYIWNCVASRRIEMFGMDVVAGDLVLEDSEETTPVEETEEFEEDVRTDKYKRARPVTPEEAEQKKFTIFDVVLPLPGFDVNYPANEELLNVYKSEMAKDGLDPLSMVRKVKEFSFAGSYRSVVCKPRKLEYCFRHYTQPTQPLVLTDLEMLEKKKKGQEVEQILEEQGGERLAVILKLQLESSAYATMALREVMKAETSRNGELCDVKIHENSV